jgi:uncharacterized protein with HEPN domain
MAASSLAPRLTDILRGDRAHPQRDGGVTIDAFEADWRKRWLVERGVEIISEASRRLTDELKSRHPRSHGQRWRGSGIFYVTNIRAWRRR